jgi:NAD(P)-dependent dehydrogenase (short-subunit alcohol dehydrogenase family)
MEKVEKVLITGANRGIGYGLLKVFSKNHYEVFPLVRKKEAATKLKEEFPQRCYPIIADVRHDDCKKRIRSTLREHTDTLDILLNNAGSSGKAYYIEEVSSEEMLDLFNVHCLGIMRTVQCTKDFLENSSNPRVINISSRLGSLTKIASGEFKGRNCSYSYRTSKAAQNMLTICLNEELRDRGICLIALHPGEIRTELGTSEADMDPDEAAKNIFALIKTMPKENSGKFLQPNGTILPW